MIGDTVEISIPEGQYDYIVTKVFQDQLHISPRDHFGEESALIQVRGEWKVDRFEREHTVRILPRKIKTPEDYISKIVLTGKDKQRSSLGGMTREQLEASSLVSLLHITYDIDNIIRTGKIDHRLSLSRQEIPVVAGLAGAYFEEPTLEKSAYGQRQFPGIYSFLYSQIDFVGKEFIELAPTNPDKHVTLVLSLALMEQKNWHLNSHDNYGSITNITFTPETLPTYLGRLMGLWGIRNCGYKGGDVCDPEIIFHDAILLDFVEMIIVNSEASKIKIEELLQGRPIPVRVKSKELGMELASRKFFKGEDHLLSASPQYCYTGVLGTDPEDVITTDDVQGFNGSNPYTLKNLKYDPKKFQEEDAYIWQKRLDLCGIPEVYTPDRKEELFTMIENRMQELYYKDFPRTPVQPGNYPPWKYTPEYYKEHFASK